jgi:hypothetical protein
MQPMHLTRKFLVMNRDTWDGHATEDKEAIQRAVKIAYKALSSVLVLHDP